MRPAAYAYVAAGAGNEGTVAANRAAIDRCFAHGHKGGASVSQVYQKLLKRQHAMAAADAIGMESISEHAPIEILFHVIEIGHPIIRHKIGVR